MKFILAFVGTVCLMGVTHSESVTNTVSEAVRISEEKLASTIEQVNGIIIDTDWNLENAWNDWGYSMGQVFNSYRDQFKDYTTLDLSQITTAIANLQKTMATKPIRMQDDATNVQQMFSEVKMNAQQVGSVLKAAAKTMASVCGTTCTNRKYAACATKYGGQLTTAPLTIDRISSCIAAEETRFLNISSAISSQYTNALTSVRYYLQLVNVCEIPDAHVLNNPPKASGPPSTLCLTNYFKRFNNMPNYNYTDTIRTSQMQLVSFRAKRCAKLVQLDIEERVKIVLATFSRCMTS